MEKEYKFSEEHRRKISEALKGHKNSEEAKRKMSESRKGMKLTKEHRQNISKSLMGNTRTLGYVHSDETRQKISETNKGHIVSKETRQKIRESNKGKVRTLETRQRMSKSRRGYKPTEETRQRMSKIRARAIAEGYNPFSGCKSGYFFSSKNNDNLYYESSYELAAFHILEQLSKVRNYQRCPYRISYTTEDGLDRNYVPDILVVYVDGTKEVIEIKPKRLLYKDRNPAKFRAAIEYCKEKGLKFLVWTEKELNL